MKKLFIICLFLYFPLSQARAQSFSDYFRDKTLRVDYIFSGNAASCGIVLDELSQLPSWAGRRHRLAELPLGGNGQITMKDAKTGDVIYRTSFSSLFQEWLVEEEAQHLARGFENTYLLPFPKKPVEISVALQNNHHEVMASFTHTVDPDDILIRKRGDTSSVSWQYLHQGGAPDDCIDVAILAEGYSTSEMELFLSDARKACESLLAHEPFGQLKQHFNIMAVETVSDDSGVSVPARGEWKKTAFSAHFDTFYSTRYLTSSRVKDIHNTLAGIPYEHIIILANTDVYGGGGIYNAFTLTTAHHRSFAPVVVHEFGHSFAGLGDEYFNSDDLFSDMYPSDVEPWEQNLTTLVRFESKWKDRLLPHTPVPTSRKGKKISDIGVYEGGGYAAKGVYSPAPDCRMKTNTATEFCPVCQKAIERLVMFYVE